MIERHSSAVAAVQPTHLILAFDTVSGRFHWAGSLPIANAGPYAADTCT